VRILLFELVAMDGIVEEKGEIGLQVQVVIQAVEKQMGGSVAIVPLPCGAEGIAARFAAVGGILSNIHTINLADLLRLRAHTQLPEPFDKMQRLVQETA
jgi:hypothetical protein